MCCLRLQVIIPIDGQEDLDQAIALLNRNDRIRSLRLLLKQHPHQSLDPSQVPRRSKPFKILLHIYDNVSCKKICLWYM